MVKFRVWLAPEAQCRDGSWVNQAGELSYVPSFLCDSPPGGWLRDSNIARTLGTQGCEDNLGLHPRVDPGTEGCSEPYGQNPARANFFL